MNIGQVYQAVLIELEKQKAPSMLLDEFNYLFRKAEIQYINLNYNLCDLNQQQDDNLRSLNCTASLLNGDIKSIDENNTLFTLPEDYFHLKNCIVTFDYNTSKCDNVKTIEKGALRMTSDKHPGVINNYYFKPSYKCPYYYIYNHDKSNEDGIPITIKLFYGDNNNITLRDLKIDYIKYPKEIILTYENLEDYENTEKLEFSEYVCFEIINLLVKLFLERHKNPRLQTNPIINQTIASPNMSNK